MIPFKIDLANEHLKGSLVYRQEEHSFDFLLTSNSDIASRLGESGTTSIALGTLQIEIDVQSRQLLFVWGYYPLLKANRVKSIIRPEIVKGGIYLDTGESLTAGASISLAETSDLVTVIDDETGWIQVERSSMKGDVFIEFASGCVAGLRRAELVSLLLMPQIE